MRRVSKFLGEATLLALLLIAMNIGIEQLTDNNVTGAEVLFLRALCNLFLSFVVAVSIRQNIIPKHPKLQIGAFVTLGLSLLLVFTAYEFISASSVSTLQRLDIPLLAVIAIFSKAFSKKDFLLSVLAFALVGTLLLLNKTTDEDPTGYFLVIASVIVLTANTLLQKKLADRENIAAIMFVASLSAVFWGGVRCVQSGSTFKNVSPVLLLAIAGLAVVNLIVFFLINDLYKKHQPEFIRYPYLVAAFGTMIAEMIIEHKVFSPLLIVGNIAILVVVSLLVHSRYEKHKIQQ